MDEPFVTRDGCARDDLASDRYRVSGEGDTYCLAVGSPLSLLTFFAAAKKVSAAPHRGEANRPLRIQGKANATGKWQMANRGKASATDNHEAACKAKTSHLHQQNRSLSLNPFGAPKIPKFLISFSLDINPIKRQLQILSNIHPHRLNMRRKLRRLRNHRAINIANGKPGLNHPRNALAQKHPAIRASKPGVCIRKMPPNIAQRGSAKQRIGNRMQQHIGI
jgi:hypothetical protein